MSPSDLTIKSPRRILLLSTSDEVANDTLKHLTGSTPSPTNDTLSGASHSLSLKTAYYEAEVPIWIDIISPTSPSAWADEFLIEEAAEVLQALGGYVLSFPRPVTEDEREELKEVVKQVGRVVKSAEKKGWDGVCVLVLMGQDIVPHLELDQAAMEGWEDWGIGNGGWEVVDGLAKEGKRNEFGERVGWERVREALEANSWDGGAEDDDLEDLGRGLDFEAGEVDNDMRKEMEGMKRAIYGGADEDEGEDENEAKDVEEMEMLMRKMQAMRDLSADMPEVERKKFAAKAVRDLMKTL